ncbi:MAG: hypothetical protein GXY89_05420 [Tissierellia bacterium]|jgi:kynurenine formamidase|nr:hypothetical protein [Tissierellia bacterium]
MKIVDLSLKVKEDGLDVVTTKCDPMNAVIPKIISDLDGIVFDVSGLSDEKITENHIDLNKVEENSFIVFFTGYKEKTDFSPELSMTLLCELIDRKVKAIGMDFPILQDYFESPTKDLFSNSEIFFVENLDNLDRVLEVSDNFVASIYLEHNIEEDNTCRIVARAS